MEHLKVIKSDYHRNGISGEGFNVIIFDWLDPKETQTNMCAFVFKDKGRIAVTNINELGHHNIEFAMGNSWRGDYFETALRDYLRQEEVKKFNEYNPVQYTVLESEVDSILSADVDKYLEEYSDSGYQTELQGEAFHDHISGTWKQIIVRRKHSLTLEEWLGEE